MYDVVIVGGGPAGLTASIYARRAAMSALVLESGSWGGAILDARRVENYPGAFGASGYELAESFRSQARELGAELREKAASGLRPAEGCWELPLSDGSREYGRTVVLATGAQRTPLEVPGGELPGVSYCASCDGAFFRDRPVCVIGGGDTAVDAALLLSAMCSRVYLIHRRQQFRAAQGSLAQLRKMPNTEIINDAVVRRVLGEDKVRAVEIEDTRSGGLRELEVEGVFVSIGSRPNTGWLPESIGRDAGGYILTDEQGKTGLPGVFASGDVRANAFRQVVTAAADGASCAHAAGEYLRTQSKLNPGSFHMPS